MKNTFKLLIIALSIQALTACEALQKFSSPRNKTLAPVDYLERAPKIDIKNFFNGDLEAFAIIQDQNGKIENSFVAKVNGKWEENRGTVQYNYVFNGGKKDSRTWLITINDPSSYSAIGHDFIETASGRNQGNASIVNYSLMTNYKEKKQRVDFEDQFYLVDDKSAIIISNMKQANSSIGKAIISLKKNN